MALFAEKIKDFIGASSSKAALGKGNKKAKVIAVCSQKGGVGKTTTSVNLACALTQNHNKKVLVIDLDSQGHVEKSLGALIPDGLEYTPTSSVLTSKKGNMLDAIIKTEQTALHITPGDKALAETEGALNGKIGREYILGNSLKDTKSHYDFIILDCPPNLGNLTINALCASDFVVIPCEMSVLAFEGVTDLLDTLETVNERLNKTLKVLGVVFTRVDGRNITMNQVVEENLKAYFKGNIFKTRVAVNTALNKAQLEGVPIFDYAPSSSGATNYDALANEVLNKIRPKVKKAKKKRTLN